MKKGVKTIGGCMAFGAVIGSDYYQVFITMYYLVLCITIITYYYVAL